MGAVPVVIEPGMRMQRHEALLRTASVIANDCDATKDVLVKELREVISCDYLHVVALEDREHGKMADASRERQNAGSFAPG
jgi:hypothetical protein